MIESLAELVGELEKHVNELRGAGDDAKLLAATSDAADKIERRLEAHWNDEKREALKAIQRLMFNAAADCWPGWSVRDEPANLHNLLAARGLAERSVRLVRGLGLGRLREGTGTWLVGAFELALGRCTEASSIFSVAREHYVAANAPDLVLLMEGYIAIVRQNSKYQFPPDGDDLDQVCDRISAEGFKDGAAWIAQLRTASKVFTR